MPWKHTACEARPVSGQTLFPLIEAQLDEGRHVRFTVSGSSMAPLLIHGRDSVELVCARGAALKKGDIILFQPFPGRYILHRITRVLPGGYITTGDGNLHRDGFVPAPCVMGKAVAVYRTGRRISCSALHWRLLFRLWMALFPVRGALLRLLAAARRRIHPV